MKYHLSLFFLNIIFLLNAQSQWHAGISYGSSDLLRSQNSDSHYNYSNQEGSIYVGKYFFWNRSKTQNIQKYWILQLNGNFAQYELSIANKKENVYSSQINTGIRFEKELKPDLKLESSILLGMGYHTGLTERLNSGIYFREAIIIGLNKTWKSGFSNQFGLGFQHASNANLYPLNRGYELLFLTIGIIWPKKIL
ncbi:hypothetical protein GO491_07335 [Flavobacteriaceae bacterium Ap0902]|nr:hypothetical protein [Flavobacteriaceae bacterium Ap0902]